MKKEITQKDRDEIAKKLRELSEKTGHSRKDVNISLAMDSRVVKKWYDGKAYPSPNNLKSLAGIFKVSVEYMTGENEE